VTVRFLSAASIELVEAIALYEAQRTGLEYEILSDVETAIAKVIEFPTAWISLSDRVRRMLLKRFPHGWLYEIRGDELVIAAVMRLRRDPARWQDFL
jgi:hypothetical protein